MEGYPRGGENGEKGTGNKKHNWEAQNRQREVKNSIGNGEAKELICTTYVHELSGGIAGGREWSGRKGIKERKKMGQL